MKKRHFYILWLCIVLILLAGVSRYLQQKRLPVIDEYTSVNRAPVIHPDLTDTIIPPNIAPLNFIIKEKGGPFYVKITSANGNGIDVLSKTGRTAIPAAPWRRLLSANRAQKLHFDIYAKDKNNQWIRFKTITNEIASEGIDNYLVYRKIHPVHNGWRRMGIYQRNLQNFDESLVLDNRFHEGICLNCHTFYKNRPDKMLIDIRSEKYGSSALLIDDKGVNKLGTKFTYISWHPTGRLVAYSVNKVHQFFHTAKDEVRGVIDMDSLLAYYHLDSKTYNKVKYDLLKISYDIEKDQWPEVETVLSAQDTGLSILEPRISPDGRWLLFCMCDYGSFPVYHQSSDLYLIDLKAAKQTGQYKYRHLDINSDRSETWHSFSSNSRWIAFSSKRHYGIFTRTYLSYIDKTGKVYKPIILPQKDPAFYDCCLLTYSAPELVIEPVRVTKEKLGRIVRSPHKIPVDLPITMATPTLGAPSQPWRERE
jgi:hypothetical protein